jgi:phosphoribosylglycinamide formyltransferase 1
MNADKVNSSAFICVHQRPVPDGPIRLAVLVSGSGTTLQNLIDLIASGQLNARIVKVIGSRDGLGAEPRAKAAGIDYEVIRRRDFDSIDGFSDRIFAALDAAHTDLVTCAGWLSLLVIPPRYDGRIINVHPSLLPKFGGKGMFGHHVHDAVLAAGEMTTGCTVHFLDNEYDNGPAILQRTIDVLPTDNAETLAARVQAEERIALPEAIRMIVETWHRQSCR